MPKDQYDDKAQMKALQEWRKKQNLKKDSKKPILLRIKQLIQRGS